MLTAVVAEGSLPINRGQESRAVPGRGLPPLLVLRKAILARLQFAKGHKQCKTFPLHSYLLVIGS